MHNSEEVVHLIERLHNQSFRLDHGQAPVAMAIASQEFNAAPLAQEDWSY